MPTGIFIIALHYNINFLKSIATFQPMFSKYNYFLFSI